jgi:hypothetical protein
MTKAPCRGASERFEDVPRNWDTRTRLVRKAASPQRARRPIPPRVLPRRLVAAVGFSVVAWPPRALTVMLAVTQCSTHPVSQGAP